MQSPAAAIFLQDKFSYYSSPARIRIEKKIPFNIIVKELAKGPVGKTVLKIYLTIIIKDNWQHHVVHSHHYNFFRYIF